MGNDGSKGEGTRTRSHTATGGPSLRGGSSNSRMRTQTVAAGYPPVTENDFLRDAGKQNPTEQDFLTSWKGKETETVRKRNDEICSKLALGFAQVDTDRDGFIDHNKVTRIYKQVCKLADAVYSTPVFASERVGFLQWNNLFKNIPASDKHLAKALKNLDFLSFKDPGDTGSTRSYLDGVLPDDDAENRKKTGESSYAPTRKSSTGTPPNPKIPSIVTVHSPPSTNTSISSTSTSTSTSTTTTTSTTTDGKKLSPLKTKESGGTSKPRKASQNIASGKPATPTPVLPTSKRPTIPTKEKEKRNIGTGSGLRPPVPQPRAGRRSRANTGDSDVSAASSLGETTDLDDIADGEESDFGVADADLPKPTSPQTQTSTLQAASPDTLTTSPATRVDDDDDDDTNQSSIYARANAVWS